MARNIVKEYIDYDRKNIIKYIDVITEKKLNSKIVDMIANTYINIRYYDMYEHKKNVVDDISFYVKEKLEQDFSEKNNDKNLSLIRDSLIIIRYVIILEKYHDDKSIAKLLVEFEEKMVSEYSNTKIIINDLIKMIKDDIHKKKKYINDTSSIDFNVVEFNTNISGVFDLMLENSVKIPDLFSQIAINRVYNSGVINEDKMFVYYLLASREVLKDMVNFDYGKVYLLDFACDLLEKKNKLGSFLKIFDLDYLKDRIIIKISCQEYLNNKEHVEELIHNGLSFAIILDDSFDEKIILLDIFAFIIIDGRNNYPILKKYSNVIVSR